MSDALEGPRKYYDFNYLLKPAPKLNPEEQKELLVELLRAEQAGRDIVIDCIVNAFAISGDMLYENNLAKGPYVATESTITAAKKDLAETKNTLDLMGIIRKKIQSWPDCGPLYGRLYDFEMWLLREQKKKRLTSK